LIERRRGPNEPSKAFDAAAASCQESAVAQTSAHSTPALTTTTTTEMYIC